MSDITFLERYMAGEHEQTIYLPASPDEAPQNTLLGHVLRRYPIG